MYECWANSDLDFIYECYLVEIKFDGKWKKIYSNDQQQQFFILFYSKCNKKKSQSQLHVKTIRKMKIDIEKQANIRLFPCWKKQILIIVISLIKESNILINIEDFLW